MAEDVTERVVTSLIPFSDSAIDGVIQQLEFKPDVIYVEEKAYINTFEQPFWHFVEASSEALEETDNSEAAEAYRRGVYIMHDLFRRQRGWKPGVLPTITVDLLKSYIQDIFERIQEENYSSKVYFNIEGDRLEQQEVEITRLFDKLREKEGDNFVFVKGGLADAYFLYAKAIRAAQLEAKFKVAPE